MHFCDTMHTVLSYACLRSNVRILEMHFQFATILAINQTQPTIRCLKAVAIFLTAVHSLDPES